MRFKSNIIGSKCYWIGNI